MGSVGIEWEILGIPGLRVSQIFGWIRFFYGCLHGASLGPWFALLFVPLFDMLEMISIIQLCSCVVHCRENPTGPADHTDECDREFLK